MTMDYIKIDHWIIDLVTQVLAQVLATFISKAINSLFGGRKKKSQYKLYIIKIKAVRSFFYA